MLFWGLTPAVKLLIYEMESCYERFLKRMTVLALVLSLCLSVTACSGKDEEDEAVETATFDSEEMADDSDSDSDSNSTRASAATSSNPDGTWAIYWYICGSDLESGGGAATSDLEEMKEVELPDNVTVVIQTGGATQWQNDYVDPNEMGRYVYNSSGFEKVDAVQSASMGDPTVLADFLSFCKQNYPADNTMVLFWNYGGNTRDQGYTNMVDLGHLVENASSILPDNAKAVQDALTDCVVYKVNGPYRQQSTGVSSYYSYDGDLESFSGYDNVGAGLAFKHYFGYLLQGELSDATKQYISEMGYSEIPPVQSLKENLNEAGVNLEDYPVTVDNDGYGTLDLGSEIANMLSDVFYQLYYVSEEKDLILMLGRDDDIDADWEKGVFKDNFRGVWGAIDGHLCYMEIVIIPMSIACIRCLLS